MSYLNVHVANLFLSKSLYEGKTQLKYVAFSAMLHTLKKKISVFFLDDGILVKYIEMRNTKYWNTKLASSSHQFLSKGLNIVKGHENVCS